jgi:crotonobetainyl-CoA:carnitine CoA-transferase CaiB-like acyl-CoA transferase
MSMPLEGTRVLEWCIWQAGPGAGMMLGDLGADVIKIEDRVTGDPSRGLEQGYGLDYAVPRAAYYEVNNRNKRGITLDLGLPKAREIVYELVGKSDAFITNFRSSVAARYGMDYETLSRHNPRLVYGLITGYGSKGPEADVRSFDGIGQARSGIMTQLDEDQPYYINSVIGDAAAAMMCAYGVLAALHARERHGVGQKVETSILSSLLFQQWAALGIKFIGGFPAGPRPRHRPLNPLINLYRCGDGRWITLHMAEADRFWPNMCRALDIESRQNDPRFASIEKRRQNEELVALFDEIFATKSLDEWIGILRENDCVCDRINTLDDLPTDPQIVANDYLPEFDHPTYGKTRYPPIPVEFSRTPGALRMPAPEFGQHTEEVLQDLLGYTWEQITELRAEQVI